MMSNEDGDTTVRQMSSNLIKVYWLIIGVAFISFAAQFILTALLMPESVILQLLCTGSAFVLVIVGIFLLYLMLERQQRVANWIDNFFLKDYYYSYNEKSTYTKLKLPDMPILLAVFFVTLVISGALVFIGCFFTILAIPIIFICITSPSLMWVSYVYSKDIYEPEPARMVLISLTWGMLSTIPALVGNTAVSIFTKENAFISIAIGAPLIEEFVKGLGIYFARKDIDNELDGAIYGVSSGIGFSVIENMFYVLNPLVASVLMPLQPNGYVFLTLVRGLACVMLHAIGPAAIGIGYGYYARMCFRPMSHIRIPIGYAIGVIYHMLWNGSSVWLDGLGIENVILQILVSAGHIIGLGFFVFTTLYFMISYAKTKDKEHWIARRKMRESIYEDKGMQYKDNKNKEQIKL